jgi:hemerythrin-like domain-containing protein
MKEDNPITTQLMHDFKNLNQIDPLRRNAEKDPEMEGLSPMDPPDAYSPPNLEKLEHDQMHPFLRQLADEHQSALKALHDFEDALFEIRETGISRAADKKLRDFFEAFDDKIVPHNQKEERTLFPLLRERLMQSGEHGKGEEPVTGVDVLEDDHAKALQLAAVVFNFFGLAMRLPDAASRAIVMDAALEQGKSLIEMLKLHIFREENVLFAQAQRLLGKEEMDAMSG